MEVPTLRAAWCRGGGGGPDGLTTFGTKRGKLLMTARRWTAQQMLDWGEWSARWYPGIRSWPRAGNRPHVETYALREPHHHVQPVKRPLKKLLVEDLKLHTVSRAVRLLLRIAAGDMGDRMPHSRTYKASTSARPTTGATPSPAAGTHP